MMYLSVCSGIEAATQAWKPLGWKAVAFSEIEPFPCAVLAHRYPDVPNWGDLNSFKDWPDADLDVLCGGTPCQDYSVAGPRLGMAGKRGQLTLRFIEIAARYRPRWLVWENVPGVFSTNGGRDFARFLGDLSGQQINVPEGGWSNAGIIPGIRDGYGLAYRVLDAQFVRTRRFPFAVPQRRRRVWVVGYIGDWRRAAAVLFDRESLSGNPPPGRRSGQVSPTIPARSLGGGGLGTDFDSDGGLIAMATGQASAEIGIGHGPTLTCNHEAPIVAHTLRAEGFDASKDGTGRGIPLVPVPPAPVAFPAELSGTQYASAENLSPSLSVKHTMAVAFDMRGRDGVNMPEGPHDTASIRAASGGSSRSYLAIPFDTTQITSPGNYSAPGPGDPCHPLAASAHPPAVALSWAVRRLTPRECERLMGFPDDFTLIPKWRNFAARTPAEVEETARWIWTDENREDGMSWEDALALARHPDGPRYKSLGNSWAVNCAEWIGERIAMVEAVP